MTIRYLLQTPCTITGRSQSATVDAWGQPTTDTTSTETKCWLDQATTDEDHSGIEAVRVDARIYLLPDVAVDENDRISVEGLGDWEVVGQPNRLVRPNRVPSHIEADCRKVNA